MMVRAGFNSLLRVGQHYVYGNGLRDVQNGWICFGE
jgi:hypothetical protein